MPSLGLTPKQTEIILAGQKRAADALRILLFVSERLEGATSDECLQALTLTHASGSARFSELVHSGCLNLTNQKKRTRAGGLAVVHKVSPKANFGAYLNFVKASRVRGPRSISAKQSGILAAGEAFLRRWKSRKTEESKAKVLRHLVQELLAAARLG